MMISKTYLSLFSTYSVAETLSNSGITMAANSREGKPQGGTDFVNVDYFAPIQRALNHNSECSSLLFEDANKKSHVGNKTPSSVKKMNRKRRRASNFDCESGVSSSESAWVESPSSLLTPTSIGSGLFCKRSKKKRRHRRALKRAKCWNRNAEDKDIAIKHQAISSLGFVPGRTVFETDFNIPISSFTASTYIPLMRREELTGRYFESFLDDLAEPVPYEPVTDDTVLQMLMYPYDNTKKFMPPNPDTEDYLESIEDRFCDKYLNNNENNVDNDEDMRPVRPYDKKRQFEIEVYGNIVDFEYNENVRFVVPSDTNFNRMMTHTG